MPLLLFQGHPKALLLKDTTEGPNERTVDFCLKGLQPQCFREGWVAGLRLTLEWHGLQKAHFLLVIHVTPYSALP